MDPIYRPFIIIDEWDAPVYDIDNAPIAFPVGANRYSSDTPALIEAALDNDISVVEQHISSHRDLNIFDPHIGQTALMIAARRGHSDIVRLLLSTGEVPLLQTVDKQGTTALMHAARCGQLDTLRLLIDAHIKAHIDLNARNKYGETALTLAAVDHEINNIRCTCMIAAAIDPKAVECSICSVDGGKFTQLGSCGHYFHTKCIKTWFVTQFAQQFEQEQPFTCPMCRAAQHFPSPLLRTLTTYSK
jgi:hypothetical protein